MLPRIKALQQRFKNDFVSESVVNRSEKSQIRFADEKRRFSAQVYQVYKIIKDNPSFSLEAAELFLIAHKMDNGEALEMLASISVNHSSANIMLNKAETPKIHCKQAVCYLLGIGDYPQSNGAAYQLFAIAAEHHDVTAMFFLGWMCREGKGVKKDIHKAFNWFYKAAQAGDAAAQNELGWMYQWGEGVAENAYEAIEWFGKAAEQGYASAQNNLGYIYQWSEEIERDSKEAYRWCRRAAHQGHATARNNLGYMYEHGLGVEKNLEKAVMWYQRSAEQGHPAGQNNLGYMLEHGKGIEKNAELAAEWYQTAAEQDFAVPQSNLGEMYQRGVDVEQDEWLAEMLFRRAADNGDSYAATKAKEYGWRSSTRVSSGYGMFAKKVNISLDENETASEEFALVFSS